MAKKRLDNLLIEMGLFETKNKAQASILAGKVRVNGEKITKAGFQIKDENPEITIQTSPYVSRGGYKLEKALKEFNLNIDKKTCLDAGASTGGFTDCLLQNGAKKVFAVDVGYGQIDWKLRSDERVVVIERTNIKNCTQKDVYGSEQPCCELATADLSFISLSKVLENIKNLLTAQEMILLIKPQFEAGKQNIEKGGVVKNKNTHFEVIKNVLTFAQNLELYPQNLTHSPITGPAGNIEYVVHLKDLPKKSFGDDKIKNIINEAFLEFKKVR